MKKALLSLLYHDVTDNPESSGFQGGRTIDYTHTEDDFDLHLQTIMDAGHPIRRVSELTPRRSLPPTFLLTFDDGGASAMHIAERLDGHHVKGHFFITTDRIGTKGFLTCEELVDLHQRGHVIGSHSHTHPDIFSSLSLDEATREWSKSRSILEKILKTKVNTASVPGGDMDDTTIMAAAKAGIEFLFCSKPTTAPWAAHGVLILGRICPKRTAPLSDVQTFVKFEGIWKERLKWTSKSAAKSLLAPLYKRIVSNRRKTIDGNHA